MMFMSMVVHVLEFLLMSLIGIMLYKLYSSYKGWKESAAFSSARRTQNVSQRLRPLEDMSPAKVNVTQVHVRLTKSSSPTAAIPVSSGIVNKQTQVKRVVSSSVTMPNAKTPTEIAKPNILHDYIGEFFTESPTLDLEPFRAEVKESIAINHRNASASLAIEDEVISVESDHPIVDSRDTSLAHVLASQLQEENIPTLQEYSEIDPDAFITVAANADEVKLTNKIMSDKVVLAMLDEAKLVCAS